MMGARHQITDKEARTLFDASCLQISRSLKRIGVDPCVIKVDAESWERLARFIGGPAIQVPDNLIHNGVVFQLWEEGT